jgi:hypothetical protein
MSRQKRPSKPTRLTRVKRITFDGCIGYSNLNVVTPYIKFPLRSVSGEYTCRVYKLSPIPDEEGWVYLETLETP